MKWIFILFILIAKLSWGADLPSYYYQTVQSLNDLNNSQKKYNFNCAKDSCQFLTTITRDDYFGNWSGSGEAYQECLGRDGQRVLRGGSKQIHPSTFMNVDESHLSFAKRCGQEPAERRGHLQSKYLYLTNRLEAYEQEILSNLAISDYYVGKTPLESINCNSNTSFSTTQVVCRNLQESCLRGSSIEDTIEKTKNALAEIKEMNEAFKPYEDRITEFVKRKFISDRGAGYREIKLSPADEEEYQFLKSLREAHFIEVGKVYQRYPWLKGKTFKSLKDKNLKDAIQMQLKENSDALKVYLGKVRENLNCINGTTEDCDKSEFYEFIQETPDVEVSPSLRNDQKRILEINQCFIKNQNKDESNWSTTKAVGNLGLMVGGTVFATPRIARGLYVMYQEAKTLSGAASLAGVATFSGLLAANSVQNIYNSCSDENKALEREVSRLFENKQCPLSTQSFLTAKDKTTSCTAQIAIEAVTMGTFYLPASASVHAVMRASTLAKKSMKSFFQGLTIALGKGGRAVIRSGSERLRPYTMENGQIVQRVEELRVLEGMKNISKEELDFHLMQAEKLGITTDDLVVTNSEKGFTISQWLLVDSISTVATNSKNNVLVIDVAKASQGGGAAAAADVKDRVTDLAFRNFSESAHPDTKQFVMFADLDNLGLINYLPDGMVGGDKYINEALSVLSNNLRSVSREAPDIILKRGGDEYVILLEVHAKTDKEAAKAVESIMSRVKDSIKNSAAREPFENARAQFQNFQNQLSQSRSFSTLTEETQLLIQRTSDWKALPVSEQQVLMSDSNAWQKFIREFAHNSRDMRIRAQILQQMQPGLSIGYTEIVPGINYQQLINLAEAKMRADKVRSAIPGGKPSKEKMSFDPNPISPVNP